MKLIKGNLYAMTGGWPFYFTPDLSYKTLHHVSFISSDTFGQKIIQKEEIVMFIKKTKVGKKGGPKYQSVLTVLSSEGKLGCLFYGDGPLNDFPLKEIEAQ